MQMKLSWRRTSFDLELPHFKLGIGITKCDCTAGSLRTSTVGVIDSLADAAVGLIVRLIVRSRLILFYLLVNSLTVCQTQQ